MKKRCMSFYGMISKTYLRKKKPKVQRVPTVCYISCYKEGDI